MVTSFFKYLNFTIITDIMIHVQFEGKVHSFCMLFDSYSSFKLVGIHEHDKMLSHSCILYACMQCMDNKQIIFHIP